MRLDVKAARRVLQVLDRDEAQELVEDATLDLIHRQRRPARIARLSQARCRRCNLFVANPARPCDHCGFIDTGIPR